MPKMKMKRSTLDFEVVSTSTEDIYVNHKRVTGLSNC